MGNAQAGMASNAGPTPPPLVVWISWALFASLMFFLGTLIDDALRRWELQPHWRKVTPTKAEAETLRLT
jgi:hypothetical protein